MDINSILGAILGPVNNTIEGIIDPQPSEYRRMNSGFPLSQAQRTGTVGMGKPGAPTTGQLALGGLLNALGGIAPGRGIPLGPRMQTGTLSAARNTPTTISAASVPEVQDIVGTPESPWVINSLTPEQLRRRNDLINQGVPRNDAYRQVRDKSNKPVNRTLQNWEQSNYFDWEQQIPRIAENLQAGRNLTGIANDLNIPLPRLADELFTRGMNPQEMTPFLIRNRERDAQIDTAVNHLRSGRTVRSISEELGITRETLNRELEVRGFSQRLADEGVRIRQFERGNSISEAQRRRVIREAGGENYEFGTQARLARELGVTHAAINTILRRHQAREQARSMARNAARRAAYADRKLKKDENE